MGNINNLSSLSFFLSFFLSLLNHITQAFNGKEEVIVGKEKEIEGKRERKEKELRTRISEGLDSE